uniref:Uncharacterized protein n=1 Tax=Anguilla anguilla TaxID=7936 RepID=A0A0E9V5E2_ANGAN
MWRFTVINSNDKKQIFTVNVKIEIKWNCVLSICVGIFHVM